MVVDPYLHFYIYTYMYPCLVQLPPYYVGRPQKHEVLQGYQRGQHRLGELGFR